MQDQVQLRYWIEQVALFDDQFAYEKLFLHFNDGLYHLALSLTRSEEIAEEIVSDAFLNIWRNRSRLLEIENLKLYLYVSVKNLSIRYLSRNKTEGVFSLDELFLEQVPATSLNPEDMMVSQEMMDSIRRAVDGLPPKCKLIFKLVREDGLRYKEIAQLLDISVKTIDAQMAIAGRRICETLRLRLKK